MQPDSNRVVIRERNYADLLDLSLRVIRTYALPLAVAFAAGAVPAFCLNAWLLAGLARRPADLGPPSGYLWCLLLLVLWEIPLATAPLTLYLGQALFHQRPQPGKLALHCLRSLPQ
jgi:hypothetical protein